MVNQKILDWIISQEARGYAEKQLKDYLLRRGYDSKEIDLAFQSYKSPKPKSPLILCTIGVIIWFLSPILLVWNYFISKKIEKTLLGSFYNMFGLAEMLKWMAVFSMLGLIPAIISVIYLIKISKDFNKSHFIKLTILGGIGLILSFSLGPILILIGGIMGIIKSNKLVDYIQSQQQIGMSRGKRLKSVRKSGFAIASLVLGLMFFIPLLGAFVGILAIIFGVISLVKIKNEGLSGKGFAIAGIILGSIGIIFTIVLYSFLFSMTFKFMGSEEFNKSLTNFEEFSKILSTYGNQTLEAKEVNFTQPKYDDYFSSPEYDAYVNSVDYKLTQQRIDQNVFSINSYRGMHGEYPRSLEDANAAGFITYPQDAYNRSFHYNFSVLEKGAKKEEYLEVRSSGGDGVFKTKDDIYIIRSIH